MESLKIQEETQMIDQAGLRMDKGYQIACERIQGVNDNMAKSHYHEYFELYYLESGKRYHIADDTLYCLNSGEFILFPPYVMHHSYGDSDVSFKRLVLYFTREMIAVPGVTDVLSQHAWVYKSDEKNETHGLLRALLKEQEFNDNYSEEALYFILNQILILLLRNSTETAKPEKQSRITSIVHYLHENYTYPITLNELAEQFYLSPYYLCREFKKYTNSTIVQYINSLRVGHAQRLFMETDKSVTEISKIVGFSNVTHFNRVYRSVTGLSPSKSRKQAKERSAAMERHGVPG